jgi:RND family efflux transporter MFP subunit
VVVIVCSIVAFVMLSRLLKTEPATASETVAVPRVTLSPVQRHDGEMIIEADGIVVPFRDIQLAAEVAGRITKKTFRAGDYVAAGSDLMEIEPKDYRLEKERLEKELAQAANLLDELDVEMAGVESLIEVADREVALRERELQRQRRLAGVVTSDDLERAEANWLAARNGKISQENRLRLLRKSTLRLQSARDLAQSKLDKATLDLDRTRISAPVNGVIVSEMVEVDEYVQKGTALLTMEDTSKVEVKCKLEMEDLFWLWDRHKAVDKTGESPPIGRAYEIPETDVEVIYRLAGRRDQEYIWQGRLNRFDGLGLDETTRTVPCRVVVDEPLRRTSRLQSGPPALVRGMYVTIRIGVRPKTQLWKIPEEAIRPGNAVWRVRENKLAIVPIHFVTAQLPEVIEPETAGRQSLVYVDDPTQLTADDQVVVSPLALVRNGMDVLTDGGTMAELEAE